MRNLIILILSLFVFSLFFGCAGLDPSQLALLDSTVQKFLVEHPNAKIQFVLVNASSLPAMQSEIISQCGAMIPINDYYKVKVVDSDSGLVLTLWVTKATQETVCGYKESASTNGSDLNKSIPSQNPVTSSTNPTNPVANTTTNSQVTPTPTTVTSPIQIENTYSASGINWQKSGDIPEMANGNGNTESVYYFNPRITIGGIDYVPAHDSLSASEWCKLVPGKNYSSGESFINWANPISERKQWNGSSWVDLANGDYPRYYQCSTEFVEPVLQEPLIVPPQEPSRNCPPGEMYAVDCNIILDGHVYDVSWQSSGDIPEMANGNGNLSSEYYFNPRITIDGNTLVPFNDTTSATKWCKLLRHTNYTYGESFINWANPLGDRERWTGTNWVSVPNSDYPRYYHCTKDVFVDDSNMIDNNTLNQADVNLTA